MSLPNRKRSITFSAHTRLYYDDWRQGDISAQSVEPPRDRTNSISDTLNLPDNFDVYSFDDRSSTFMVSPSEVETPTSATPLSFNANMPSSSSSSSTSSGGNPRNRGISSATQYSVAPSIRTLINPVPLWKMFLQKAKEYGSKLLTNSSDPTVWTCEGFICPYTLAFKDPKIEATYITYLNTEYLHPNKSLAFFLALLALVAMGFNYISRSASASILYLPINLAMCLVMVTSGALSYQKNWSMRYYHRIMANAAFIYSGLWILGQPIILLLWGNPLILDSYHGILFFAMHNMIIGRITMSMISSSILLVGQAIVVASLMRQGWPMFLHYFLKIWVNLLIANFFALLAAYERELFMRRSFLVSWFQRQEHHFTPETRRDTVAPIAEEPMFELNLTSDIPMNTLEQFPSLAELNPIPKIDTHHSNRRRSITSPAHMLSPQEPSSQHKGKKLRKFTHDAHKRYNRQYREQLANNNPLSVTTLMNSGYTPPTFDSLPSPPPSPTRYQAFAKPQPSKDSVLLTFPTLTHRTTKDSAAESLKGSFSTRRYSARTHAPTIQQEKDTHHLPFYHPKRLQYFASSALYRTVKMTPFTSKAWEIEFMRYSGGLSVFRFKQLCLFFIAGNCFMVLINWVSRPDNNLNINYSKVDWDQLKLQRTTSYTKEEWDNFQPYQYPLLHPLLFDICVRIGFMCTTALIFYSFLAWKKTANIIIRSAKTTQIYIMFAMVFLTSGYLILCLQSLWEIAIGINGLKVIESHDEFDPDWILYQSNEASAYQPIKKIDIADFDASKALYFPEIQRPDMATLLVSLSTTASSLLLVILLHPPILRYAYYVLFGALMICISICAFLMFFKDEYTVGSVSVIGCLGAQLMGWIIGGVVGGMFIARPLEEERRRWFITKNGM